MSPDTVAPPEPVAGAGTSGRRRGAAALAGLVAAAVALGVSQLAAGLFTGVPSLVLSVGSVVIDAVPPAVKDVAIAVFGLYDKVALVVGTLIIAGCCGAGIGIVSSRRRPAGIAGFAAFGVLGVWAAARDPQTSVALVLLTTAAATTAGVVALLLLLSARAAEPVAVGAGGVAADPVRPGQNRREFLHLLVGATAVAVITTASGRVLAQRGAAAAARRAVALPPPAEPAVAPPDAASFPVDGLSPLFTPNDDFYRIDTALSVPQVQLEGWRLEITGMVDRPLSLSFDDLLAMPQVEADVTLVCVSNEVGGRLAGNARWSGVRLADLLARAGVHVGATQVVGRSVDGWTAGFPTEAATDGRDALIAVGMNGEPLPLRHGFPARLVVPGLYGYVSATKWLTGIELTTWEGFDAYWVPRGWAKEGPIKTQSRIDVPSANGDVAAGTAAVAGVAWGGLRGISRVEVAVDGGPWREAELAEPLSEVSWRQWLWEWDAVPGRHTLAVRATDGEGAVQTPERQPPAPDGATGHHTIQVDVA